MNAAELGRLVELGRRRHEEIDRAYRQTLAAIAGSLEIRGLDTGSHTRRVTAYAMRLTVEVAPSLSDDPGLEWGFMFHDIGNIGIPDRILLKRSSLKAEDWKVLQKHTTIGEQLLEQVPLLGGEALRVVRSHHERWDGSGYPDGLAGQEIPLAARIFSVADALDAMTDRRPYRRPLRWEAALARIRKGSGESVRPGRGRRPRRLRAGSDRDQKPVPRAGARPRSRARSPTRRMPSPSPIPAAAATGNASSS